MKFQFSIRDLLWLFVVIALVVAWRIDRSRVPQWEYLQVPMQSHFIPDANLDKPGTEGWELAGIGGGGVPESRFL